MAPQTTEAGLDVDNKEYPSVEEVKTMVSSARQLHPDCLKDSAYKIEFSENDVGMLLSIRNRTPLTGENDLLFYIFVTPNKYRIISLHPLSSFSSDMDQETRNLARTMKAEQVRRVCDEAEGILKAAAKEGTDYKNVGPRLNTVQTEKNKEIEGVMQIKSLGNKETTPWDEIGVVIVDDHETALQGVEKSLRDELGMTNIIGKARSAEGAITVIEQAVQEGKPVGVVVLDRSFFVEEKDCEHGHCDTEYASKKFLHAFNALVENPSARAVLGRTIIVIHSSCDDPQYEELRKFSPRIVAKAKKYEPVRYVADALATAGMVDANTEKVIHARTVLSHETFNRNLKKFGDTATEEFAKGKNDAEFIPKILELVNTARQRASLTSVSLGDGVMTRIVSAIREKAVAVHGDPHYLSVIPEVLFAEDQDQEGK